MPQRARPTVLGGLFFVAYFVFQMGAAVSCLAWDQGCLLTWTMYTGRSPDPAFYIVWESGEESLFDKKVGVDGVGRVLGSKMDTARFVPPYLCEHISGADAIRLEHRKPPRTEVISCN